MKASLLLPLGDPVDYRAWWSRLVLRCWIWPRASRDPSVQVVAWSAQPHPSRRSAHPSLSSSQLLLAWSCKDHLPPSTAAHASLVVDLLETADELYVTIFVHNVIQQQRWELLLLLLDHVDHQVSPSRRWLGMLVAAWHEVSIRGLPNMPVPLSRRLFMSYQRAILFFVADLPPQRHSNQDAVWKSLKLDVDVTRLCDMAIGLDWPGSWRSHLLLSIVHNATRHRKVNVPLPVRQLQACAHRLLLLEGTNPSEEVGRRL